MDNWYANCPIRCGDRSLVEHNSYEYDADYVDYAYYADY